MKTTFRFFVLGTLLLLMSACNATTDQNPTELPPPNEIADAATKTAEAIAETPPIILSAVPNLTDTPTPRPTFTPTNTSTPWIVNTSTIATMYTATNWIIPPLPTLTPIRTPTPVRTAPILPPCDFVEVQDLTVEVGSDFAPSEIFVKTWKFKNIGSCTWTTSYSVVLISGNSLSGPGYLNLPSNVAPGQSIEISIDMQAPAEEGNYIGTWMLRNEAGKTFGSGPTSSEPFVVEIDVLSYLPVSYHFAQMYCRAIWTSGYGTLTCPDSDQIPDTYGFVRKIEKPLIENGNLENEPVLFTHPQMVNNGYISGKFPAYTVQAGEHLYAVLTCQYGATACDVLFSIDYQVVGTPTVQSLGTWNEIYDDTFTTVDLDLAALVGKSVQFIFTVRSNGAYTQDEAFWLAPIIDLP